MLKIRLNDVNKVHSIDIFQQTYSLLKNRLKTLFRSYSRRQNDKVKPITLAYSSYESTDFESQNQKAYPIMIMHGLLGSKNNWRSLSKAIHSETGLKVIAVDARNHGDSPQSAEFSYDHLVEDIRYLMNDLQIPKINAVGHSLGGRAMMLLALRYPHLVNSLIVVDISPVRTSPAIIDISTMFNAMMAVKFPSNILITAARKIVDEQLRDVVRDTYIRQFLLTNLVETEGSQYKWRVNLQSLIDNFSLILNFKTPNSRYKGPVLFIGGGNSTFLREDDHKDTLKLFPQAKFKYVDGAGHWVHSEKPKEFLHLTCDFLKTI